MDRQNPYFVISGFISLSLFTFFLVLFFTMMFSKTNIKTFALEKNNFISISFDVTPIATKQIKPIKKVVPVVKEIPKVVDTVKEIDISNLFSEVWTEKIKVEKKPEKKVDTKRLELIQKKIQKSKENLLERSEETLQNNYTDIKDKEDKKVSTGDEVNEYLAKIQAIVYKYFQPPANSQGYTVKAVIQLNRVGKVLDFRILTYSENQVLNQECDKIKQRLIGVLFPINPENKSSSTVVNITSDK